MCSWLGSEVRAEVWGGELWEGSRRLRLPPTSHCRQVMEVYEPGFMTWVHDYHLLLLPSYILRRHHTAHIGLFLHSPFPASDVS